MKVKVTVGDLFKSEAQTLINTVNCVGVMGKGVALQFKQRFPQMFDEYASLCAREQVKLGEPYIYKGLTEPWVLNFPTKHHWKMPSDIHAIERGLEYLEAHVKEWGVTSIASPPLGCGLGQLDWRVVGPILYRGFEKLAIPVFLYAPPNTPDDQMKRDFLVGRKSVVSESPAEESLRVPVGLVAVVEALRRIISTGFYFPGSVGFHKMVYFGTELGLPTGGLQFVRDSFGPFSRELQDREIPKLVNNGLLSREMAGDKKIEHSPGKSYDYANWKLELKEQEQSIRRLVDLFQRLKTTDQAELYATAHFCARELAARGCVVTETAVASDVAEWKKRRRVPFAMEEIGDAVRTLNLLDWIDIPISEDLPLPMESRLELTH